MAPLGPSVLVLWALLTTLVSLQTALTKEMFSFSAELPQFLLFSLPTAQSAATLSPRSFPLKRYPQNLQTARVWVDFLGSLTEVITVNLRLFFFS